MSLCASTAVIELAPRPKMPRSGSMSLRPSTSAQARMTIDSTSSAPLPPVGRGRAWTGAGSLSRAPRSTFLFGVCGSSSIRNNCCGTMADGRCSATYCCRSSSSAGYRAAGTQYRHSRGSDGVSSRITAAHSATAGCSPATASISPSSIRWPRSLTWASTRPQNSRLPSGRWRTTSPVRYIRAPGVPANGSATKRSAVSSGRCRYPRATPRPPMCSSPRVPRGTRRPCASRMYSTLFSSGSPRATSPGAAFQAADHTVVSVGPYMFISPSGHSLSSLRARPRSSASPPTSIRSRPCTSARPSLSASSIRASDGVHCRCVGAYGR